MSNIANEDLIETITSEHQPSEEELAEFKVFVNDFFKYDDQIKKLETAIKERKTFRKNLNNKIQNFMFNYKYNDLNTEHGRLKTNVRGAKVPIKMSEIKDKILKYKELSGEELLKSNI